jgi:hypothetical protein
MPDHRFAFFNVIHTVGSMHLLVKYLEYGLMKRVFVDPKVKAGTRSMEFAALDLTMNSRMIGMGPISVDKKGSSKVNGSDGRHTTSTKSEHSSDGSSANGLEGPDGGVVMDGQAFPSRHQKKDWLPPPTRPISRTSAVARHFRIFLVSYITLDTLLVLLSRFGKTTIALPGGSPNALKRFLDTNHFVLFPKLDQPIDIPRKGVEVILMGAVGIAVYVALQMMFHFVAFCGIASGIWDVKAFEVDYMNSPWKADSLLDLWGRRWHQQFRVS